MKALKGFLRRQKDFSRKNWLATGLQWGVGMFIVMQVGYPLVVGDEIALRSILIGIPLWLTGGIIWGGLMHIYFWKDPMNNEE